MELSNHELSSKLENEKEILQAVRDRLQQLEIREARMGFNTPPEVVTEIHEYAERIKRHESEIERLQALTVEDQFSSQEADYRVLLAEVWCTPTGRPTAASKIKLERDRLRMGIALDRAQELEHEIRVALAVESLTDLDLSYGRMVKDPTSYQAIVRAFRLDESITRRILAGQIRAGTVGTIQQIATQNMVWSDWSEREDFLYLLANLKAIAAATNAANVAYQAGRAAEFAHHQVHQDNTTPLVLFLAEGVELAAKIALIDYTGRYLAEDETILLSFKHIIDSIATWPSECHKYPEGASYEYAVGQATLKAADIAREIAQPIINSSIDDTAGFAAQAAIAAADAAKETALAAADATESVAHYTVLAARTAAEVAGATVQIAIDVARAIRQSPPLDAVPLDSDASK